VADGATLPLTGTGDSTVKVATDDTGATGHAQIFKLAISTDGAVTLVPADAANGLDVDVTRLPALPPGSNAIGKLAANSGVDIGDVDILSQPAADRQYDSTASAHVTDAIMNDRTPLTPKFFKANIAASTTDGAVITAVAGKKLRILSFRLHAGGTATNATFNSKPAGAGSAISELFACAANGGRAEGFSPVGHFETVAGEGLTLTTAAGSTVGVGGTYIEV
jgi:hypothetical protein